METQNPYLNQPTKRFVSRVIVGHFMHKAVVYHVKTRGVGEADETIILAANHRWRDGYLMVVMREKDMDQKEAQQIAKQYTQQYIWCQYCHNAWDGAVSFRIDIKDNHFVRVVCAVCDPTVDYIAGFWDSIERQVKDR
jgi:RNase P subunit RPR2